MAKTFHSPYITILDTAGTDVTGVIDYVKAVGGGAQGLASVTYQDTTATSVDIELGNGDSVYGPFKSVEYKTAVADMVLVVHERSKIIES